MQSIGLVLCVHQTQPYRLGAADLRLAFERTYQPLLAALEEFPAIRATVHWSGPLLEWMENHAPDALRSALALIAAGRIEVLGGLWGGAVLPAIPERDAVGQVQAMMRWWKAHQDVKPRGVWLPYTAWDPSAARILSRLGLQYTILEEAQFHPPVAADGYYLTEREGQALGLFVADTRLGWMIPDATPARLLKALALRAAGGTRCVVLSLSAEALGSADDEVARRCFSGPNGWVKRFFRELSANAHWIKLVTGGAVLDRVRPTDRAWPPAGVCLPVAVSALGGEHGAEFESIITEMRRNQVPDLVRCGPFLRAAPWEGLLPRHAEVNRLHKRMLRASLEVLRLRTQMREGRGDRDPRFAMLEEATLALYRGQSGAAYVLGVESGAQDGQIRNGAYAELIRAERVTSIALGEADRIRAEQVDYDCDGRAEVIVRTPHLCGIVAPSAGGSLVELDAWELPGNLLNTRTRRPEPEHPELSRVENLPRLALASAPVVEQEEGEDITEALLDVRELPPLRLSERDLADHIHYDRHTRSTFLDHFLGPEATLENWRRGRYPEAGDFCGADYQLLQVDDGGDGSVAVSMGRDGSVNEGAALRLVRVVKRFVFHQDLPVMDARYEVSNRYHEPVRSRFGVELNLNLDSACGDDIGLHVHGERYSLTTPGEHAEVSEVSLHDRRRNWRVSISLAQPARLWHHPVETVSRTPRGVARCFQGTALMLWWPVELWGLERKRLDLSLTLET